MENNVNQVISTEEEIIAQEESTPAEVVTEENAAEEIVTEETVAEEIMTEETATEEVSAEEIVNEEVLAEDKSQPLVFTYDDEYARQQKTNYSNGKRLLVMAGFILAGVVVLLIDSFVLPTQLRSDSLLVLGLALMFFAAIIVPQGMFKKRYESMFTSYIVNDNILWRVKFRHRKVNSKYGRARQRMYIEETFAAAHDASVIAEAVENYKLNTLKGTTSYKRPRVTALNDIAVVTRDKKSKCTYTAKSGSQKEITILDCYPGLLDYIEKK